MKGKWLSAAQHVQGDWVSVCRGQTVLEAILVVKMLIKYTYIQWLNKEGHL